jgi:hypothetical protein
MITKEQVEIASKNWANARKQVREAIAQNQKAMTEFRVNKNSDTQEAYKLTRENHAKAISHIKKVRTEFYTLKFEFESQEA